MVSENPFTSLPAPSTSPGQALDDAVARVQAELDRKNPMAVASDGWDALETASAEYLGAVGVLAIRYARDDGLPEVHKKHIGQACAYIGSRPRATVSVFITSTLGGLFAGVGGGTLGSIYTVSPAPAVTDPLFIFSLIMSLVGFVLVITSIGITIVSRRR
jgi:hypothetical protein